jgi:hypothetical protein
MKYLSFVLILITIIALSGCGKADYTMTTMQFADEYTASPAAAETKYVGKTVKLSGTIMDKGHFYDRPGVYLILFANKTADILVELPIKDKDLINSLRRDDITEVQGKFGGTSMGRDKVLKLHFTDAKVIK